MTTKPRLIATDADVQRELAELRARERKHHDAAMKTVVAALVAVAVAETAVLQALGIGALVRTLRRRPR